MNGGQLAGKLKLLRPKIKVAFMSGYSEFAKGQMGNEFSQASVQQKPFSPASLVGIVREAVAEISSKQPIEAI
jgi:DNA-binding NtrC family response regulator